MSLITKISLAAQMCRAFTMVYAVALALPLASSMAAESGGRPGVFLNKHEIAEIRALVAAAEEPWSGAFAQMMAEGNAALGLPDQSVTFQGDPGHAYFTAAPYDWSNNLPSPCGRPICDGLVNPKADRADYQAAIDLCAAVRSLGLAYAFTGDGAYADKAVGLIRTWCLDPSSYMEPRLAARQGIEHFVTFPGLFYGADLIWDHSGWEATERAAFARWTRTFAEDVKSRHFAGNWENWRQVFVASAGALLNDQDLLDHAFTSFKAGLPDHIGLDGRMRGELRRTTSLQYSIYALIAMTEVAEIARHQNVDLYGLTVDGRGLYVAWDFHVPYLMDPSTWRWQQIAPISGQGVAAYEMAATQRPDRPYHHVLARYGRPLYDQRVMGPVTLTHAPRPRAP